MQASEIICGRASHVWVELVAASPVTPMAAQGEAPSRRAVDHTSIQVATMASAQRIVRPAQPKARWTGQKTVSVSHSWAIQCRPGAVHENGSAVGTVRVRQISRPVATCQNASGSRTGRSATPVIVANNATAAASTADNVRRRVSRRGGAGGETAPVDVASTLTHRPIGDLA